MLEIDNDSNLKDQFKTWLSEEIEALTSKNSRMYHAYRKAADRLNAHPDPIKTPKDLKSISYVGEKIFLMLCSKLQKHCRENNVSVPSAFENYVNTIENGKRRLEVDEEKAKKLRRKTQWIPKRKSGGWAMLIALSKHQHGSGLSKDDLIVAATPYCDGSFTSNPAARDFYSAWDGMKTLLNHEYVCSRGRPKIYAITEAGLQIARLILQKEGLADEPVADVDPDVSYDNGIRATPDTSQSVNLFVSETSTSPLANKIRNDGPMAQDLEIENIKVSEETKLDHDVLNKLYGHVKYDIWCPDDYEIVLFMDTREVRSQTERDYFQTRIIARGVTCDVRNLSLGDVLWVARHKTTGLEVVLNYVCERKRLDDLAMSIRDGRFTEQKSRLKNSGLKNIFYLVEEGGLEDVQRIADMKQAIETSISMVMTNSKFFLKRFRRTDDTIEWLLMMTEVLKQKYQGLRLIVLRPDCINTKKEYIELLQNFRLKFEANKCTYECVHKYSIYQASMTKTTMMTVKEMFILMLMLIKGMSLEKAIVMQSHFRVPRSLIEFFLEQGVGKTEHEKGVLIMDLFQNELGNKRFNKSLLMAVYEVWGKE